MPGTMKDRKILKVMSFNIRSCFTMKGTFDPSLPGKTIAAAAPDVCGIQEIRRGGSFDDCPAILGNCAGMSAEFGAALDLESKAGPCKYGIAALCRSKYEKVDVIRLPHSPNNELRLAVVLKVYHEGGTFYFITTHLSYESELPEERLAQMKTILDAVRKNNWTPAVLTGDLNAVSTEPCMRLLAEDWQIVNSGMRTISTDDPTIQIDYIAFYPATAFSVRNVSLIPDDVSSDHFPITADLYFEQDPEKNPSC